MIYMRDKMGHKAVVPHHTVMAATRAAADATGIVTHMIHGRSRIAPIVMARHLSYYLLREEGWTYTSIARSGNRNHSTVISGVRRMYDILDTGHWFAETIKSAQEKFKIEVLLGELLDKPEKMYIDSELTGEALQNEEG